MHGPASRLLPGDSASRSADFPIIAPNWDAYMSASEPRSVALSSECRCMGKCDRSSSNTTSKSIWILATRGTYASPLWSQGIKKMSRRVIARTAAGMAAYRSQSQKPASPSTSIQSRPGSPCERPAVRSGTQYSWKSWSEFSWPHRT